MKKKNNKSNVFYLLRIIREKTVKDLADELRVTPAYINAIENNDRFPSDRLIRDYAKALNVKEEILLNFSSSDRKDTPLDVFLLSLLSLICKVDSNSSVE